MGGDASESTLSEFRRDSFGHLFGSAILRKIELRFLLCSCSPRLHRAESAGTSTACRLNGLAQPDFIRQQSAFRERRVEGEQCSVHLVQSCTAARNLATMRADSTRWVLPVGFERHFPHPQSCRQITHITNYQRHCPVANAIEVARLPVTIWNCVTCVISWPWRKS